MFRPVLSAYKNLVLCFFFSSYVGFVQISDLLAILVSNWQGEFLSTFLFVAEKKTNLVEKFL